MLLHKRWPWHVLFWLGYVLFRLYVYYITITYYQPVYLEYMLLSEIFLVVATYFTLWLYKRLFELKNYFSYFLVGAAVWTVYLCAKTIFQFYYLQNEPGFKNNRFSDIILNNITVVLAYFLFITTCKYFKDGYIRQQFDSEKKQQQLLAEVNNLKSQIAPHFLFNTLNNLYGLAVDKSDKLPDLMLRLSELLRHSLYETQKPLVPLIEEISVLKSYIKLESVRMEEDLELAFNNDIPENSSHQIAPLLLIVFVENAFKHAKFVQPAAVDIYIKIILEDDLLCMTVRNNYSQRRQSSANGLGLHNVKRRLEVLYPNGQHQMTITRDEVFYTVVLRLRLAKVS